MPLEHDQASALVDALVSLIRSSRTVAHRDAQHSVSTTPVTLLRHLRNGDPRLGDLADQLHVKPSVASRAVAALEVDGYVVRVPDPDDARATRVRITDTGREHLAEREAWLADALAAAFADWSPDEAEQAVSVLERLEGTVITAVADLQAAKQTRTAVPATTAS